MSETPTNQAGQKPVVAIDDSQKSDQMEEPVQQKRSPLKPVGITLLVVGSAAIVPGIITGAMYVSDKSDLEKSCPDKDNCADVNRNLQERANGLATATSILLPVGSVIAATGIVLTIIGNRKSRGDNKLGFTPLINDNVAGLTFSGSF